MNRLNQIAPKVIHRHVISERQAVLEKVRYRAMKFGFPSKGIVRPAQIVLYAKLENGKSSLKFNVNQEMQTIPHEIRLEKSDVFYADKLGLFLHKVAIVNNVETFNSPIYSYPDPNIWTVANEARDLEGIYQSLFEFKTDTDVRLERYHTAKLRWVPETQGNPGGTPISLAQGRLDDALQSIVTNIGIWGNKRNEVTLSYPQGTFQAIAGDGTTYETYAVIYFDGFRIVRGAESMTISDASVVFGGL